MRVVPVSYQPGGTWAICDVCSFKVRLNSTKLRWDNLRVCEADWEPKPETLTAPVVKPEGLPRLDARPEPPDTFVGIVRPEDL